MTNQVCCFDKKTLRNRIIARAFRQQAKIIFGDIRHRNDLISILEGQDVVIHLAGMLPPQIEQYPDLSYEINVKGTQNIIDILQSQPAPPFFIYASSNAVHGINPNRSRLVKASDPLIASDHYSKQKIECEKLIHDSRLDWVILRISSAIPLRFYSTNSMLFNISLNTRIEFTHPYDVALAIANCIGNKSVYGKTLLIGGGPRCQMIYRDMIQSLLECAQIGMFPDCAFSTAPYYTDWMDTQESESLLHYQQHTFNDFLSDFRKLIGWRKSGLYLLRPLIQWWVHTRYC
jgi:UDP-glucose 4-epimerase